MFGSGPWTTYDFTEKYGEISSSYALEYWLIEHLKGPYILRGSSTAHWARNLKLTHPDDVVWIRMHCPDIKKVTESIGGVNDRAPQRVLDISEVSFKNFAAWNKIVFGQNVDEEWTKEWLKANPLPISSALLDLQEAAQNVKAVERARQNLVYLIRRNHNIDLSDILG